MLFYSHVSELKLQTAPIKASYDRNYCSTYRSSWRKEAQSGRKQTVMWGFCFSTKDFTHVTCRNMKQLVVMRAVRQSITSWTRTKLDVNEIMLWPFYWILTNHYCFLFKTVRNKNFSLVELIKDIVAQILCFVQMQLCEAKLWCYLLFRDKRDEVQSFSSGAVMNFNLLGFFFFAHVINVSQLEAPCFPSACSVQAESCEHFPSRQLPTTNCFHFSLKPPLCTCFFLSGMKGVCAAS